MIRVFFIVVTTNTCICELTTVEKKLFVFYALQQIVSLHLVLYREHMY